MKKTTTQNTQTKQERTFRDGKKTYDAIYVNINKYGMYVGLKNPDGVEPKYDFVSGYEACNLLNGLLNEFDSVEVEYGKATSNNGKDYETCTALDYKI